MAVVWIYTATIFCAVLYCLAKPDWLTAFALAVLLPILVMGSASVGLWLVLQVLYAGTRRRGAFGVYHNDVVSPHPFASRRGTTLENGSVVTSRSSIPNACYSLDKTTKSIGGRMTTASFLCFVVGPILPTIFSFFPRLVEITGAQSVVQLASLLVLLLFIATVWVIICLRLVVSYENRRRPAFRY